MTAGKSHHDTRLYYSLSSVFSCAAARVCTILCPSISENESDRSRDATVRRLLLRYSDSTPISTNSSVSFIQTRRLESRFRQCCSIRAKFCRKNHCGVLCRRETDREIFSVVIYHDFTKCAVYLRRNVILNNILYWGGIYKKQKMFYTMGIDKIYILLFK